MKTIGICGFGYSGSGAVWDYLKGVPQCCHLGHEKEFPLLYEPDGIDDLRFHLMERPSRFMASDMAINRFLALISRYSRTGWEEVFNGHLTDFANEYVSRLVQLSWNGYWTRDVENECKTFLGYVRYRLRRKYNSLSKLLKTPEVDLAKSRKMYLSILPDAFWTSTRTFLDKLIEEATSHVPEVSCVALNQPFPANCPLFFMDYFPGACAILVDRDPRDVYCLLTRVHHSEATWFAHSSVDDFIRYYRVTHGMPKDVENGKILRIHFEDLVYDFRATGRKILDFCQLDAPDPFMGSQFNPDISVQNTNLFKSYGNPAAIEEIERQLPEFLYQFPRGIGVRHDSVF